MKKILSIALTAALALSVSAPSLAAGPKEPAKGDQKGIIATLIERALEGGTDPSVYIDVQTAPADSNEVAGPLNFQEQVIYIVLNHEPKDIPPEDPRLPVLLAVREFITQNTPLEKQAELCVYQYCEEREIVDVREFEENSELFFDLVYELALLFEIIKP